MKIRILQDADLAKLLGLYEHLHSSDVPLPDSAVIAKTWSQIQSNPDLAYFGVFDENDLVSSCTLSMLPNLTRGCRPYGIIENVVTAPSYRRQGLGKAVLEHALEYAWTVGCYKVMLLTGRKDEGTYRFYAFANSYFSSIFTIDALAIGG